MRSALITTVSIATLFVAACQPKSEVVVENNDGTDTVTVTETKNAEPTRQEAKEFLERAEAEIEALNEYGSRIYWVQANFITEDTSWLAKQVGADFKKLSTKLANEAKKFNELDLPDDMARKLNGLKRGSLFPAPNREEAAERLAELEVSLGDKYSTGKFEYDGKELSLGQLSQIIATSRDPEELQTVWEGWREVAPAMKKEYTELVGIANEGSRELGFKDTGDLWRGGYDMEAEAFAEEADRLWGQVKPLYDQLHCYVRAELNVQYGDEIVPLDQPIRADLLGNMWAQSWGNIYDMVEPEGAGAGIDVTQLLIDNDYDQIEMVETAEGFFTSLGFEPLPQTFWDRSLITEPRDRSVACHASAWNIDDKEDIRIKMCTQITGEDFVTVHHELGHNFYQRAYKDLPVFYKDGANDGFHEAIGDMVALSITPDYLVQVGLLAPEDVPGEDEDIALLMRQALDKIAFLPFGIMIDQWRWKVFSGEYSPDEYNSGWWELREKYQGIRPPSNRPSDAFDAGAKYHIPNNVPYMRYFLAHILQFQFHKSACEIAGYDGPLHRCSVYGNEEVGSKFDAMLKMGSSKPWPDALEAFTGTREMDGSAVVEYFAPLMTYLEEENKDRNCGW